MIITSEYIYNIVENTLEEHKQRYECNFRKSVKVKCDAEYLDKLSEIVMKSTIVHSMKN